MNPDTKELVTILIRGMKFTIALLEKWIRGEKI